MITAPGSRLAALALAAALAAGAVGCAGLETRLDPDFTRKQPETVAILPFSAVPSADADTTARLPMVRQIFDAYFSNLGYHQPSLDDVDQRLRRANLMTPEAIQAAGPKKLGEILDVDAVVFGKEFEVSSTSAVIFYRRKITGKISLVGARAGDSLWDAEYTESDTGGVLLDSGQVVQAISATIEVGRDVTFVKMAQAFCRTVVSSLPPATHDESPHDVPPDLTSVTVRVVGTAPLRAGDRVEVTVAGAPGGRGTFDLKPLHVGLPLSETTSGVYQGVYVVEPGEASASVAVSARLVNRFGATARKEAPAESAFAIDSAPPPPPNAIQVAKTGAGVELQWQPPQNDVVKSYEVFRAPETGTPFTLVASTADPRWVDPAPPGPSPAYQIVAVDMNGNVSFPAGPATLPKGTP
jgi:protein involved in polysaccharide export with SLBB domain